MAKINMAKDYLLTRHAIDVIRERKIKLEWIESVLKNPARVDRHKDDPMLMHALGYIPDNDNRVLRVVYNTNRPWKVVTAYFDRKMRNKL